MGINLRLVTGYRQNSELAQALCKLTGQKHCMNLLQVLSKYNHLLSAALHPTNVYLLS